MLNKLAVFLLALTTLSGCGYKGALYIPDAPSQIPPPSSDLSSDESEQTPNNQTTVSDSVPKTTLINTSITAPIKMPLTKLGDPN
ncbi:LPS translocon maturation chaperone LptM [Alteromonas sp. A081]|uniref:LPS translocon maturation chaperone LptM n=1 Tax=Alteromonas sp. A081 TaxID=3410269 RepID=UPI003B9829BA